MATQPAEPVTGPRYQQYMPLSELQGNLDNPKAHDLDGLEASMQRLGFVEPITVDERTGLLVSGHGRVDTLKARKDAGRELPEGIVERDGEWFAPVNRGWHSADDAEAKAALVALNRHVEQGGWLPRKLHDVLDELRTDSAHGLDGVGYTADALDKLAQELARETPPPTGADDEEGRLNVRYSVMVDCAGEKQQVELLERLAGEGFECRALLL
jgi:hypothetical protein